MAIVSVLKMKELLFLLLLLHSIANIASVEGFSATTSPPSWFERFFQIAPQEPNKSSNIVHEALLSRRTINAFEAELPDQWEASLEQAVKAATMAPNHKRTEPWRFHLLGPKAIRRVCELNASLVRQKKGDKAAQAKLDRWLEMPGWLVVTCIKSKSDDQEWDVPNGLAREDYAACCCAVQNLSLSLHANGMGTKWTTGDVNFHEDFFGAVGLSGVEKEEEYVVGTIWFGKPVSPQPATPRKKLGMEQVLAKHE